MHRRSATGHRVVGHVHAHHAELADGGRPARPASQYRTYACNELAGAERLGQIVVGTRIERLDLLGLVDARRQHDDRYEVPSAEITDEVDAIPVGKPEIQ